MTPRKWFFLALLIVCPVLMAQHLVNDQIIGGVLENLTADPGGSGAVEGRVIYRTDTNQMKVYNGASWETVSPALTDPMTTRGDILYRDAANTTNRLALGNTDSILTSDGTDLSWFDVDSACTATDAVCSGTYTPTLTNQSFVLSSSVSGVWKYIKIGSIIMVAGEVNADLNSTNDALLGVTIPIATDFTSSNQANGTVTTMEPDIGGNCRANATFDRFNIDIKDLQNTGSTAFSVTCMYQLQ